ncbi:MAG: efflux RND transporter periplasmic adaptor subunit [Verrucomicrobiota bacterium]
MRISLFFFFAPLLLTHAPSAVYAELEVTGLIEPNWEATLAPTILGRVEEVLVKEGQRVDAGAPLIFLERTVEQLEEERRRVVADSMVEIEISKAKLEVLKSEFEGTQRLFDGSGSVSKEELDRARLDFRLAEAELAQLKERKKIEILDWNLAKEQVTRREIRAPQKGIVVEVLPEVGEVYEARQPLVRIVDAATVRLVLDIDALQTGGIEEGSAALVEVRLPEGEVVAEGKVDFVSPVVDRASGLRRVRILIDNEEGSILPGLPALVKFKEI